MTLAQITQPSNTDRPSLVPVHSQACPAPAVSHGDKAKARDILAAIRTLKALQAAHTLDAAPQRSAPRSTATVEEAITTRIRQREQAEAAPQPEAVPEPVSPAQPASQPATAPARPATPPQARPEPWTPPQQLRLF